jgi:hypothetical protein
MKETTEKAISSRSFDVVAAHFGLTCMTVPVNFTATREEAPSASGSNNETRITPSGKKLKLRWAE